MDERTIHLLLILKSPLTSPALVAQDNSGQHSVFGARRGDALDTSAIEIDFIPTAINTPNLRKSKRKSMSSTKPPTRVVRESPAMKAQRRRQVTGASLVAKEVAETLEASQAAKRRKSPLASTLIQSQDTSEASSTSPESLPEALMPPPAVPRSGSAGRSPLIQGHVSQSGSITSAPATPASLMRIQKMNIDGTATSAGATGTENLPLALDLTALGAWLDPQAIESPASIKSSTIPTTHEPIHQLIGPGLPSSAGATPRMDPKSSARQPPKSTRSTQPSPALRPRISPSIKPLLPEGTTLSAETSALLLASKSNYERIIDGSTSCIGVNYPSTLSENLTSKRTSHKLAEQGRRNRINSALAEIAILLPQGGVVRADSEGTSGNSKASTVELASDYIKALKSELEDTKARLRVVEGMLAEKESESKSGAGGVGGVDVVEGKIAEEEAGTVEDAVL